MNGPPRNATDRVPPRALRVARTPLLLFLTILTLAIAQIVWWVVLLLRDIDPERTPPDDRARSRRIVMVTTEGTAFAVAMCFGAWLIYRSLRREEQLRSDEANFLAAVTHELKSPLASLRLHAESLELRAGDPERVRVYGARMIEDVDRLQRLVENLLAAGRAQAGALDVRPVEMQLSDELRRYIDASAPILAERGFELKASIEDGVFAPVDPAAFRTVVENLMDNAIKYSEPPASISLTLMIAGGSARLEVTDRGVGLDRGEADRVFDRFYRAGDERVRTTKGTGLGLYLVREIARAHGGDAGVESAGRGRGSTFWVIWPGARPVAQNAS